MQLGGYFPCHHKKCRKETLWELLRGGKRARCTGCGDVYPCRGACEHLDCKSEAIETHGDFIATEELTRAQAAQATAEVIKPTIEILDKKERARRRVAAWRARKANQ